MTKIQVSAILCGTTLILAIVLAFTENTVLLGIALVTFFLLLAVSFQRSEKLKGYSFTVMILAAVTAALFYPQYFVEYNGFKFTGLITPLIQLIMFGMGTAMSIADFAGVVKFPKGVLIGISSQFMIMPLIGFTLASFSGLAPEIAAGIILIGSSPSGMASNVIAFLAKANVALSVTITAISTMMAPFITPLLMKLLAGEFVEIEAMKMMWDITKMVILPIGVGLLFNRFFHGKFKWMDKAMPIVSMFGITFSIVVIIAAGRDSLLDIGPILLFIVLMHNLFGYFLGYWYARLFRLNKTDCRTIAIEVGMQNGGLASGLAKEMGKIATIGLAPAIFGSLMNITGSILASVWKRRNPEN